MSNRAANIRSITRRVCYAGRCVHVPFNHVMQPKRRSTPVGSFFVRPTELLPLQIKCARAEIDDAVVRAQDFGAEQAGDGRRSVQKTAVNQTFQIDHADVLAQNIDRTDRQAANPRDLHAPLF